MEEEALMKRLFYEELRQIRAKAAKNSVFLTDTTYQKLVDDVETAKTSIRKKPRDYWLLKRYDVLVVENKRKLIYPIKEGFSTIRYYVADSELFCVLHDVHLSNGHGRRDKMLRELSAKYKNITRHDVELYIQLCEHCRKNQKGVRQKTVVVPMPPSGFNSSCQVDFIEFDQPEFKFIMVYQDNHTQFVVLKALTSKRVEEVEDNLLDIFSLLGPPSVLYIRNYVGARLKEFWPGLKIVKERSQNEGGVKDIVNMLYTWMEHGKSDRWSEGLRFVQFLKNGGYHPGVKRTPYEAVFGCKPEVGLTTTFLQGDLGAGSVVVKEEVESDEDMEEEGVKDEEGNQHEEIYDSCSVCIKTEEEEM